MLHGIVRAPERQTKKRRAARYCILFPMAALAFLITRLTNPPLSAMNAEACCDSASGQRDLVLRASDVKEAVREAGDSRVRGGVG